jgi:poly(A) polymerase
MLRAVRFAAKLGLTIAPESASPIAKLGTLLRDVPPARLFDELLKLFHSGHAVRSFELLLHYDLLQYLFKDTNALLATDERDKLIEFVRTGLASTDTRVQADKPVTPMFLYAVFLWFPIRDLAQRLQNDGWNEAHAMAEASHRIVAQQQTTFPRRFSSPMKELLAMQWRFGQRQGSRAARLLQHKRFRAAYDFLLLRARCGEVDRETADWWTEVQRLSPEEQQKQLGMRRKQGRRRRGGRRRSAHPEITDAAP